MLYDARRRRNIHSTSEVRQIINEVEQLIHAHGPRGAVAFVAMEPAEYGMARMYAALAEHLPFAYEVFNDFENADRWLTEQLEQAPQP